MGGQRRGKAVERKKFQTAVDMAEALPHLFKPISDSPTLIGEEQDSLAQCEAAVETLKAAFWAAGKALHIIRDARLYRQTHKNFNDYCDERWGMQREYADKLIRTWPIAEALIKRQASGELTPIGVKTLNQAQTWELVPAADTWDVDAATFVYETVIEVNGEKVTAEILNGAVNALPKTGEFDKKAVKDRIVDYFANISNRSTSNRRTTKRTETADPIAARAEKAIQEKWLRKLAAKDQQSAAAYIDHIQRQLNALRAELLQGEVVPGQREGANIP
ncbi:hypothetical protein ACH4NT_36540 [Streptomyces lydicus]|uniref:hypothetical protein n=1 Tax=Streptomyces lydicus TaxID=47763 RepID=UPI00379A1B36